MKLDLQWNVKSGVGLFPEAGSYQCAVATASTGQTRLISRPAAPATEGSPAEPANLPRLLTELQPEIGKGRFRLATAVNSRDVFCKHVSIPSTDAAEVGQMLSLQVEKWSPLPLEEVVWSYEILGPDGNNSDVLVVFGRKETLIHRAAEFGEEFLPDLIDVDLMVLWRALRAKRTFEGKGHCALLWVDVSARIAKCMVLKGATPLLIEHLPLDAADPSVLSRAMSHLLLGAEAARGIGKIEEILLIVPDDIRAAVGNELGIELRIPITPLPLTDDLTAAAGLAQRALHNGVAQVNLLPMDFVEKQQKKIFRQQAARVSFVVLAAYLVVLLIVGAGLAWRKYSTSRLESKVAALDERFQNAQKLQAQVEFLKRKLVDPRSALETLRVVSENMGEQVSLTHFGYRQGQTLELRGTGQNASDVYKLIDKLETCGLFSQVKLVGEIRGTPATFTLSCTFGTPPPKAKAAAANPNPS